MTSTCHAATLHMVAITGQLLVMKTSVLPEKSTADSQDTGKACATSRTCLSVQR